MEAKDLKKGESKPNKSFTELELRIAAKNISLQFGVVEILIAEARKVRNIKNGNRHKKDSHDSSK